MAELTYKTVEKVLNDDSFITEIRSLLIELGDEELSKPDNEIDFDFIDECTNALLMLDEDKNNHAAVIPFITSSEFVDRFADKHIRYKRISRFLKYAAVAALIATSTITVNAAIANITGHNILKETGQIILSVFSNNDDGEEDKEERIDNAYPDFIPAENNKSDEPEEAGGDEEVTETDNTENGDVNYYIPHIDLIDDEDGPGGDDDDNGNGDNGNQNGGNNGGNQNGSGESGNTGQGNEGENGNGNQNGGDKQYDSDIVPVIDDDSTTPVYKGLLANFDNFKGDYIYGEEIDYENIKLKKLYSDGSTEPLSIKDTHYTTGIDMNTTHDATIKIIYNKTTVSVEITVRPDEETRGSKICENEDYTYLLTDNGAYITSYSGTDKNLDLATLDGNKVYAISNSVFKNRSIKSINAPNVEKVFDSAFEDCGSLTDITLSDKLSHLGKRAFKNTKLTELEIPSAVTVIPEELCCGCKNLEAVTFKGNVTKVCSGAFEDCTKLTEVNGTSLITEVEENAFCNDESVEFEAFPQGLKKAGDAAFYSCKALTVGSITPTLKEVGKEAFAYCYGVTDITLSDSVTTVPEGAFKGTGAKTVVIPEGVKVIEPYAFNGIKAKSLSLPDSVTKLETYSINSMYLTEIRFGNGVEKMGESAVYAGRRVKMYVYENSVPYQYAVDNGIKYELI